MTEDQEHELRIKCIELAQVSVVPTTHIIDLARKYYWFIIKDREEK